MLIVIRALACCPGWMFTAKRLAGVRLAVSGPIKAAANYSPTCYAGGRAATHRSMARNRAYIDGVGPIWSQCRAICLVGLFTRKSTWHRNPSVVL
jgi:hypothetical protein